MKKRRNDVPDLSAQSEPTKVPDEAEHVQPEVTVVMKARYCATTMQAAIDAGVNGFALTLLAESLGDKGTLVDGGTMFTFPHDHKGRTVWITVTGQRPEVLFPESSRMLDKEDGLGLGLSPREREILDLIDQGDIPKTIADKLCLAKRTVDFHLGNAYAKLGVQTRHNALIVYRTAKQRTLQNIGGDSHVQR
jgi:DNA-binding CsgD family transcriptional regulator